MIRYAIALAILMFGSLAHAQTAHEYFDELKAANAFTRYKDEYVCFRDDNVPSFVVVAKVSDMMEFMKNVGDAARAKMMSWAKDGLAVQTYYKGVGSNNYLYNTIKTLQPDDKEYFIESNVPNLGPIKMVYSINWLTGRYRLRVFMLQKSRTVPVYDGAGKCELIHPARAVGELKSNWRNR